MEAAEFEQRFLPHVDVWWPPTCGACIEYAEKWQAAKKDSDDREAAIARESKHRNWLESTGLPRPYLVGKRGPQSLDTLPQTDGLAVARMLVAQLVTGQLRRPWIYLHGANGTGKSTVACCALLAALELRRDGRYLLWPDALDELRALNRDDAAESVNAYVKRHVAIPHLVIDEIGSGTPTPFAAEKLFNLIEKRYQEDFAAEPGERWTIFTSNRDLPGLMRTFAHVDDGLMAQRFERRIADIATAVPMEAA